MKALTKHMTELSRGDANSCDFARDLGLAWEDLNIRWESLWQMKLEEQRQESKPMKVPGNRYTIIRQTSVDFLSEQLNAYILRSGEV
jgi:hypothetical protein